MKPKVTVCIPVYNVERYLEICLESVINQTLRDIEIICVEDCSSDNSKKILEIYAVKDSRIKVIWHNKNLGLVKTRKDAVAIAHGDYIMFLDSDDELFPYACETAYKTIENKKTDMVEFGIVTIDDTGRVKPNHFSMSINKKQANNNNLLDLWIEETIKNWQIWNKIYRSDFCKKAYSEMEDDYFVYAEDVYFFFVFGYYARTISVINDELYKYRWSSGISTSFRQGNIGLDHYKQLLKEKDSLDAIVRFVNTKADKGNYQSIVTYFHDLFLHGEISLWFNFMEEKSRKEGFVAFSKKWSLEDTADGVIWTINELKRKWQREQTRLEDELQRTEEELQRLQNEVVAIKSGWSFKLGRIITFIPRKMRELIQGI